MTIESESNKGLSEKEVTSVLDLLGTGFEGGGIIREVSFPDLNGSTVRIFHEIGTGPENKTDVESSAVVEDIRFDIEKI